MTAQSVKVRQALTGKRESGKCAVRNESDVLPRSAADEAFIPSNYSRLIARVLELQVAELPDLLMMTGLSVEQFMQEDTMLTTRQQIQILQNGASISGEEAFGFKVGQKLTPPTHGPMGFLAICSPNLIKALDAFKTYLPTRMQFARADFIENEEWLEGECYFDVSLSDDMQRCLSEVVAKIFFDFVEFILGRPLIEAVTGFPYTEPHDSSLYNEYLSGAIEFSATALSIKIPIELCYIANSSTNQENYLFAMRQCEMMQSQLLSNRDSCKYQIQKMMLSHPPGVLCEEEAAAALFISKRTLARRLKKEGTGFRQIRDEILSQQAADYLRDSKMSVDAIAAMLNYHDSANFRRAFKRWFQLSPDQYRKKTQQ